MAVAVLVARSIPPPPPPSKCTLFLLSSPPTGCHPSLPRNVSGCPVSSLLPHASTLVALSLPSSPLPPPTHTPQDVSSHYCWGRLSHRPPRALQRRGGVHTCVDIVPSHSPCPMSVLMKVTPGGFLQVKNVGAFKGPWVGNFEHFSVKKCGGGMLLPTR